MPNRNVLLPLRPSRRRRSTYTCSNKHSVYLHADPIPNIQRNEKPNTEREQPNTNRNGSKNGKPRIEVSEQYLYVLFFVCALILLLSHCVYVLCCCWRAKRHSYLLNMVCSRISCLLEQFTLNHEIVRSQMHIHTHTRTQSH